MAGDRKAGTFGPDLVNKVSSQTAHAGKDACAKTDTGTQDRSAD